MDYQALGVPDLRKMARDARESGHPGFADATGLLISGMSKAELIARLSGTYSPNAGSDEPQPTKIQAAKGPGDGNGSGDLADVLARALSGKIKAGLDKDAVSALVDARLDARLEDAISEFKEYMPKKQEVTVISPDGKRRELGRQHAAFETVLKLASLRLDSFLVGPAGSGKTSCAHAVANALALPFYMISVGLQTSKADLLGYMDATGSYRSTMLRKAYETGGVFLMDEIDSGNANVLTVVNAMLSNGIAAFPDAIVERHRDFIFIAAGNTWGRGADRAYVGRNSLDGATLDRFASVLFDYDEALEEDLSSNKEWAHRVMAIRRAVFDMREKLVVSPRASIKGGAMISAGFTAQECEDMLIFRGCNEDLKKRILEAAA